LQQIFNHRGEVIDCAEHDDCPASSTKFAVPRIGEDAQIEQEHGNLRSNDYDVVEKFLAETEQKRSVIW
jgi:hypothetical protein